MWHLATYQSQEFMNYIYELYIYIFKNYIHIYIYYCFIKLSIRGQNGQHASECTFILQFVM